MEKIDWLKEGLIDLSQYQMMYIAKELGYCYYINHNIAFTIMKHFFLLCYVDITLIVCFGNVDDW
jgi:hypothetical protein